VDSQSQINKQTHSSTHNTHSKKQIYKFIIVVLFNIKGIETIGKAKTKLE